MEVLRDVFGSSNTFADLDRRPSDSFLWRAKREGREWRGLELRTPDRYAPHGPREVIILASVSTLETTTASRARA